MNLDADIALAHRLADAARAEILPHFRQQPETEAKEDATPVSVADRAAEEAMRRILKAEVSADGVHGEEMGLEQGRNSRLWVLDPIDGTTAFLAGRPIFATLIALVVDGFPVLGMIDQPVTGERWLGVMGQGTTFNGQPVTTRRCRELAQATIATTGPQYFSQQEGDIFMALASQTDHKRMVMGGDCYNYGCLASGHIDIVCEAGLKLHDFAALVPVVEGAGGTMSDWNGEPLHAGSDGRVLALGDPARLEDVLEAMAAVHSHDH
ncbi:inositol monophosphatase family protein [Alteraurantiacibacter aquimixticola]|uniref:Inositol monophosphatase family protein n=1 Tax=Alteraurantiacibacter aquimixticola TaxID=2489173 RepID=A0A4T3EXW9_9SPHN|nr:inositol monophosphatase family protein [Alteraurantiacibacter aquimixticola]TIX49318.1 inositol monophosphatase family protein [Alteraurantiacibacter aquimixticola]